MKRLAGILCGIVSAVSYGTNPLFAVPLLRGGYGVDSMLFFRFSAAALLLAPVVAAFGGGFRTTRAEAGLLIMLGALFAFSSQALFWSFTLMPAGVASAILFLYPVFTAAIMAAFFGARMGMNTAAAMAVSLCGVMLLSDFENGGVTAGGVALVVASALSYAAYMVAIKVTRLAAMNGLRLTFYSLLFAALAAGLKLAAESRAPQIPDSAAEFWLVAALAVLPTFVSITFITYSIRYAGPTVAAVLGAFEPATAVAFCSAFLGEDFTARIAFGMALVIVSVVLISLPERKNLQCGRLLRNS